MTEPVVDEPVFKTEAPRFTDEPVFKTEPAAPNFVTGIANRAFSRKGTSKTKQACHPTA